MGIVDEDVASVRQASDIVGIISQHTALRKVGRRFQGLCPFHAEKTPSFSVNAEDGLYYCFGCGAKGDVITFVREVEHLDFVGAVEHLAHRAGITLRYTESGEAETRSRRSKLVDAVGKAVDFYHERLMAADDAAAARKYLRSRGLDGEVVRRYRLGWAPEGWDVLAKALRLPNDVFVDAGLGFLNKRGRPTDAFRGRVLFPIFDVSGDPVGFGGRILPDGDGPKYKNSSESSIYSKSKVLYGLNWAKAAIVAADEVVVCEGYTDVIGLAGAGVPQTVATCGTALTEEHVRLLKRFAPRVVLAFDADTAGQAAAARFYEWERAYDVEVAVAAFPDGVDPADLARRDPDSATAAIAGAVPFLGFRVDRVLASAPLDTPERRARAAEEALAVIAEHPSELVRDQYLMEVADRCGVDPDHLRQLRARGVRGPSSSGERPRGDSGSPRRQAPLRESPETEALRLVVNEPGAIVDLLDEVLFDDERHAAAFRAVASTASLHDAIEAADPGAAELLQQLAVQESDAEGLDVACRLVEEASARELARLELVARRSDDDALRVAKEVGAVKLELESLRDPRTAPTAARELVGWLRDRAEER